MKLARQARGVALTVAAALAFTTAKADVFVGDGYKCYPDHALIGAWPYVDKMLTAGGDYPMTLKECFDLCNETPGCVAVTWSKGTATKYPICVLFKSTKDLDKVTVDKKGFLFACIRLPTPKGYRNFNTPQSEVPPPIPHTFYQDQLRPGPQPDPGQRMR